MENKLYLYPGLIRIWHVLNALMILLLIISGLSMQYSDPANPFIRFDLAVSLHNITGIILIFNYLLFFYGNTISKNGRHYRIQLKGLMERLMVQFRYYTYGVFKNEPAPFPVTKKMKFNPIQQVTYFMTMYVYHAIDISYRITNVIFRSIYSPIIGVAGILRDRYIAHHCRVFSIDIFGYPRLFLYIRS